MISVVLIFLIGLSSLANTSDRRYPFLIFSYLCAAMFFIDSFITVDYYAYYYLTSAFVDLVIIYTLSKTTLTNAVILLQKVCLLFIGINFMGWLAYELYFGPFIYNSLCAFLFAIVLIASENTRNGNVLGDDSVYSNNNIVLSGVFSGLHQIQRHFEAKRS